MDSTCVEPGDVLLNITGASIGRCAVVPDDFDEANVSQHVAVIRLAERKLRQFIHLWIIAPNFQDRIMQVQVGVSREGLSMTCLKAFVVALPPLAEQRRIVAKVEELLALCDELEARQSAAREHRTRLVRSALDHLTAANRARVCDPQHVARKTESEKRSNVSLPSERCGSQSRAPQNDFHRLATFVLREFPQLTAALEDVPAPPQATLSLAIQGHLLAQYPKDERTQKVLERVLLENGKKGLARDAWNLSFPNRCYRGGRRRIGGAPKAPIIPAQPNGLGNRTGDTKALKARSISALKDFGNWAAPLALVFFGWTLDLGRCPRLVWAGPLARVTPCLGRTPVHVKKRPNSSVAARRVQPW